jgi:hypothetical protein
VSQVPAFGDNARVIRRCARLATSDAHPGLVDAIAETLAGSAWQRCRTHAMRNLLTRVPKSAQSFVATMVRTIFAQPDAATVHEQHRRIVDQLETRFPEAAALLEEAAPDLLAFTAFPKEHWRQLLSTHSTVPVTPGGFTSGLNRCSLPFVPDRRAPGARLRAVCADRRRHPLNRFGRGKSVT